MNSRILPSIDELKQLYFKEGLTLQQIADRYNVTRGAVFQQFRYHDIKPRSRGYDPVNKEYPDWTDPITQQILIGSLLDGGRFGIQGTNKETVQYLETHTLERKGHTQWKNKYLKCQYSEYDDRKVSLSSRWHPELDELYAKYYKDGRKNIPILLNNLDMNGLCVWYTCANTVINSGKSIQLATTDFTDDEQFLARDWFIKNLETLPLPQSRRVSGRQDRYLLFSDEDAQILRRTVAQTALDLLNRPNL